VMNIKPTAAFLGFAIMLEKNSSNIQVLRYISKSSYSIIII